MHDSPIFGHFHGLCVVKGLGSGSCISVEGLGAGAATPESAAPAIAAAPFAATAGSAAFAPATGGPVGMPKFAAADANSTPGATAVGSVDFGVLGPES